MYNTGIFLPTQVITNNPPKAGKRVDATQVRTLSANPIIAVRSKTESFEDCGLTYELEITLKSDCPHA